jgi:hypothetical protein
MNHVRFLAWMDSCVMIRKNGSRNGIVIIKQSRSTHIGGAIVAPSAWNICRAADGRHLLRNPNQANNPSTKQTIEKSGSLCAAWHDSVFFITAWIDQSILQ